MLTRFFLNLVLWLVLAPRDGLELQTFLLIRTLVYRLEYLIIGLEVSLHKLVNAANLLRYILLSITMYL